MKLSVPSLLAQLAVVTTLCLSGVLGENVSSQEFKLEGDALLQKRDFLGASRSYTRAIELEPSSFKLHHLRGLSYLMQSRLPQALADFSELLKMNPDFHQARVERAGIWAKQGRFEQARQELEICVEAAEGVQDDKVSQLLTDIKMAAQQKSLAIEARDLKNWKQCVESASVAIEVATNDVEVRALRKDCHAALGDESGYIADLSRLTILQPDSFEYSLELSYFLFFLTSEQERAMGYVRQALRFDPDSKTFRKALKLFRTLEKAISQARNFVDANSWHKAKKSLATTIEQVENVIREAESTSTILPTFHPETNSALLLNLYRMTCQSCLNISPLHRGNLEQYCGKVLLLRGGESDTDALTARAELLLMEEKYEEAVRVLTQVYEASGSSNQKVGQRLHAAQKLLARSKQTDHYKTLGVSKDADLKTIKKAFRTKAKENHPDVGGSETKMAQINEAYEVLSSTELREKYDNGDDPFDQSQNFRPRGNPHHPFGGGGGQQFYGHHDFFSGGGGFPGGAFGGKRFRFTHG